MHTHIPHVTYSHTHTHNLSLVGDLLTIYRHLMIVTSVHMVSKPTLQNASNVLAQQHLLHPIKQVLHINHHWDLSLILLYIYIYIAYTLFSFGTTRHCICFHPAKIHLRSTKSAIPDDLLCTTFHGNPQIGTSYAGPCIQFHSDNDRWHHHRFHE